LCDPKPQCEALVAAYEQAGAAAGAFFGAGTSVLTGPVGVLTAAAQVAAASAAGYAAGHVIGELVSFAMSRGGETSHTIRGRQAHAEWSGGRAAQGDVTDRAIPGSRLRPDALNVDEGIIRELKPNNPAAIQRGMQQLNRYIDAAQRAFGRPFSGVLETYQP
jgi:hypothetical protein